MCQKPETLEDLKQRIKDWFVKQKCRLTKFEIATIFKRSGVDRVYRAVDELVKDGIVIRTAQDPVAPQSYELAPDVS